MRIYLDSCCLQRPLDDQTQLRVRVETEATLAVLTLIQSGNIILLNSEALEYELNRIPDLQRCNEALGILELASEYLTITNETETLAETLANEGIMPMDAVHLALASQNNVDFFVTCDDKLLKKARMLTNLKCQAISILEFISEAIQ